MDRLEYVVVTNYGQELSRETDGSIIAAFRWKGEARNYYLARQVVHDEQCWIRHMQPDGTYVLED